MDAVITPDEKQLIEKKPTTNQTAYNFYLQGKEELSKFTSVKSNRLNQQAQITNSQVLAHAKELFTKALEYDSTFAQAYTGLVRAGVTQDSILILVDKALSYDNQLYEAYILRGNYYWSKGETNKAIDDWDKAVTLNPNSWEAYQQKGIMYYNSSDFYDLIKAFENLQKAASVNRGSELADIKYEIARVYRQAGFYEKSKEVALEVLKLDGDSVRYFSSVATVEGYLHNYEKAHELEKKAYKIDSTNFRIWQNLAETYTRMDNWEESLKWWKKYFESGQATPYFDLGLAYLKNGYNKEAEDIFNEIIKSNEDRIKRNPSAYWWYYDLARIYAIKGDKEKAYESLRHFSQIQKIGSYELGRLSSKSFDKIRYEPEFK